MPHSAQFQEAVQVSFGLSCGCIQRKSKPLPMIEAFPYPGQVVICDRCDEYAVVVRGSVYLAGGRDAVARLLRAADLGLSPDDIEAIASEQSRV